jgi:hypothetical protein
VLEALSKTTPFYNAKNFAERQIPGGFEAAQK